LFEFNEDISDNKKEYINFDFVDKKQAKKMLKSLKGKII